MVWLRVRQLPGRSGDGRSAKRVASDPTRMYTRGGIIASSEARVDAEKSKLVKRLSRLRGQLDALQRAVADGDASSAKLLQQATACRGAMDGFIAELIEDHIREQVVDAPTKDQALQAAEELIGIVHSYLT